MILGARRGDHCRADVLGELDGESSHAAGTALDQDRLTRLELCGMFERPERGQANQPHRCRLDVAELQRFLGDDRRLDRQLFGIRALDSAHRDAEHP